MLEKATSIKRFEYAPLGKELKKQTSVAENQYQKFESNKNEEKAKKIKSIIIILLFVNTAKLKNLTNILLV